MRGPALRCHRGLAFGPLSWVRQVRPPPVCLRSVGGFGFGLARGLAASCFLPSLWPSFCLVFRLQTLVGSGCAETYPEGRCAMLPRSGGPWRSSQATEYAVRGEVPGQARFPLGEAIGQR